MSNIVAGTVTAASVVFTGNNTTQTKAISQFSDLTGVSSTAPTTNQVLMWDGNNWVLSLIHI